MVFLVFLMVRFLPRRLTLAGWSLFLALPATAAAPPTTPAVAAPSAATGIEFRPNQRQWPANVLFAADVPGGRLFLEAGRLVQARYDVEAVEAVHELPRAAQANARIRAHAYGVEFVGADRAARVLPEEAAGSVTSYLLGNDASRWAPNVPGYHAVRYQSLYPGTDLRLYATGPDHSQVEYDFELAPGADPTRIGLRYAGQDKLELREGVLCVRTSVGEVREQRPVAYQLTAQGARVPVRCHYVLESGNTVRFALPDGYDRARALIIDPVLVYASYTGATSPNWGFTATHDPQGNLYAGSISFGQGFPVSFGAYDILFSANIDVAIIKFNPSATTGQASRVWATFVGGSNEERPHSMVVDQQGNLAVLGTTKSTNFPTTSGAFDRSHNGASDLVVYKLNATGSALVASTYLGGSSDDGILADNSALWNNYGDDYRGDITIDAQNNVLLTAVTKSNNFPTQNAFQATRGGGHDVVIAKLPPALTNLTWSSYFGGSADDDGYSIQVDSLGGVYVGGGTASRSLPNLGGLRSAYGGGPADGFVLRVGPTGTALTNFTYLGTTAYDQAYFVQLDRQGAVYALGQTAGAYPVSAGVYSNPNSRQFIQKLDAGLSTSLFSTVIGNGSPSSSRPNLSPTAFLVDNCGQLLLSGWGGSNIAGMPTTPDAIQRTASNSSGAITSAFGYFYIMQLAPNAQSLIYGTYYGNGSTHTDGGTSRFDKRGVIYQSVCVVESSGVPSLLTTPNAWARTKGSTGNNAAFKMDVLQLNADFTTSNIPNGSPNRVGCAPLLRYFNRPASSNIAGSTAFWDFGNGQTSTLADNVSTTYTTPGRYIVRLVLTNRVGCQQGIIATDTVIVEGVAKPVAGPDRVVCAGSPTTLAVANPDPAATYSWLPALGLSATTGPSVTATLTATTTYIVTGTSATGGCTSADTVTLTLAPLPQAAITTSGVLMADEPITFQVALTPAEPIATVSWDFGDSQTSTDLAPTHRYAEGGSYTVRAQVTTSAGCAVEATQLLAIEAVPSVYPNVITPNGDNLNDTFEPRVTGAAVDLKIFNRWGRLVYEQADYRGGWGGNVAAGTYYYYLTTTAGRSWKGWVEVVK